MQPPMLDWTRRVQVVRLLSGAKAGEVENKDHTSGGCPATSEFGASELLFWRQRPSDRRTCIVAMRHAT